MLATAGVAVVVSVVAVGIQEENRMGWGVIISVALLPILFLIFGIVVMLANIFCNLGFSMLSPVKKSATPIAANMVNPQGPAKVHQQLASKPSVTEAIDED